MTLTSDSAESPARTDGDARPVVVLCGPTAGGKSGLALALAERFGGTVINADSLQLYRELAIITARPKGADLRRAPHRLYGVIGADSPCSAGQWRDMALAEIEAAHDSGGLPIVVGGTGLYLRALQHGLSPIPKVSEQAKAAARQRMDALGPEVFHRELAKRDPEAAARIAPTDRQRQVRAWEVLEATGQSQASWTRSDTGSPPPRLAFLTILLNPPRDALFEACDARFAAMIDGGAVDEVRALRARGLADEAPVMKAVGVQPLQRYLDGEITLGEARELGQRDTRRYAKRQITWFRNQVTPDHTVAEQYSERINEKIFSFISSFLLTHPL